MYHNKIIFLDIDGCINTPKSLVDFEPELLDNLRIILKETKAKIVLSSSWRYHDLKTTIEKLKEFNFPEDILSEFVGVTIRAYHFVETGQAIYLCRGIEIQTWIDNNLKYPWKGNPEHEDKYKIYDKDGRFIKMKSTKLNKDYSYVILDDDNDMLLSQKQNFIRCDGNVGLTLKDVNKAIKILNKIS